VANPVAPAVASNVAALQAAGRIPASLAGQYAALSNLKGGLTFAGVGGVGSTPFLLDKNNFGPRVGFAYQVNDRLVIRGGFGEYYSNPNNDWLKSNGFTTSTDIVNSTDGNRTPIPGILSDPYPNGILRPTGSSLGAATFLGQNPSWFDNGFVVPSVWQFSLGFQFQVNRNSMLDVSYVGSRSYDLNMQKDYDIPSAAVRKTCNYLEGGNAAFCNQNVPNPFKGVEAFRGSSYFTADNISYFQMLRPFPQYSGTLLQQGRNDYWIKYNSLQINYNWRNASGYYPAGKLYALQADGAVGL